MAKENTPTFIQWIKAYDGVHTYCNDVKNWLIWERKFSHIKNKAYLEAQMRHDSYFEKRHFRKVDVAFEIYTEEMEKLIQ